MWELYNVTLYIIVSFKFYVMNCVDFIVDFCLHITSHVSQVFASCTHNTSYSLLNFAHVIVCVYGLTNHVWKIPWILCKTVFVALKRGRLFRGCLICVFKQPFLVFKQHFTHFHTLFHPHVFPQMFSNNNFQFLNTCTKRTLKI